MGYREQEEIDTFGSGCNANLGVARESWRRWDGFSFSTSHRPNEKRVRTFRPRSPTISLKDHLLSHANSPRANQILSNSLEESLGLRSTKPQINGCNRGTRKLKVVA
ncbi:hypothetical protein NEUTE1DRAFT_118087, partial [Neurospora tetrasperma FGSC 2508]